MPCKQNKAVVDAAASGRELPGVLRAHVNACADCRALFAQETALLAAIDSRLRQNVTAEPPLAFLKRVQAHLADEHPSQRKWSPAWAAACAVAFLVFGGTVVLNVRRAPMASPERNNVSLGMSDMGVPALHGHSRKQNASTASRTAKGRKVRMSQDVRNDDNFHALVPAEQRIATDQLITGIRQGEIDGHVLVSSVSEDLDIPLIVIPPIAPGSPDEASSETPGSSRISPPEPAVHTR